MSNVLSIVAGALNADVHALDTLSQNVANLQTPGYRAQAPVADFGNMLGQTQTALSLGNGALMQTGHMLDLALQGSGFFTVDVQGTEFLERDGQFSRNAQGLLVDAHGNPVLTASGPLMLPDHAVRIDVNGVVFDGMHVLGQLKIVDVAQPGQLQSVGGNLYAYDGTLQPAKVVVHQGALEESNVDAAGTMVKLIELSRHAQSVQHALNAYDQAVDAGVREIGTGS